MTTTSFLEPRLCGTRYKGGVIPLEILKDLAVLEEMLIEVAKWRFLQEHQDRRRSPRGFTEGIELKLTGIRPGSAVPEISLIVDTPHLPGIPPQNQRYFEQARESFVGAINAAEHDPSSVIDYLPEKCLSYFDRIGRSLREDESIEFAIPSHTRPARLTKETRRRLVLASSHVKELTEEVVLRGSIPEADQDRMTFQLQLIDGQKVSGPIPDQHLDTIIEAFNGYRQGMRVLLYGIGRYNRQNRLLRLDSVEHISILDPLDVSARLDELRGLRDGWLEGRGKAPGDEGLNWFAASFDRRFPDGLPLPRVYPTAEGGLQLEWTLAPNEVSLEVDLATHLSEWHCLDLANDTEHSRTLHLDDEEDWVWLVTEIHRMSGSEA